METPLKTLIDLRWMIPGHTGGSEVLARAFVKTLLKLETEAEVTILLPAVTRYDFNAPGRENIHFQVCDGPGYYLAKLLFVLRKVLLKQGRDESGAHWVHARRTKARVAFSPSGIIHPDLSPLKNLLFVHDLQHEYFPEFFSAQELANLRRNYSASIQQADHILTNSDFTRQSLIERTGALPEKITTAYLGVDPSFFEPERNPNGILQKYGLNGKRFLFFPANTWHHKNHRTLLIALQRLKEKHQLEPLLVCTGTPKEAHPAILALSKELGVEQQFCFLGYRQHEDMPALYRAAEALVFPSFFEGFGMPVIEAMACGCPVICSNTTSLPEVGGEAAFYIDPHDPESLVEAIYQVWTDPALRGHLIEKGSEQVKRFSWLRFTRAVLGALQQLGGVPIEDSAQETPGFICQPAAAQKPNRQERAQDLLHRAADQWKHGKRTSPIGLTLKASLLAPEVAFTTWLFPTFRDGVLRKIFKLFPV